MNGKKYIKETIRKAVNKIFENEVVDSILDKINRFGMESLTPLEIGYLNKSSKGINDTEAKELLSIDTGYVFRKNIPEIGDVSFTYDSTEEYDEGEIVHKGDTTISGDRIVYSTDIFADDDTPFSFTLHDGNDYVEFNDATEELLSKFFEEIAEKINKTL